MKYLILLLVVVMSGCGLLKPKQERKRDMHLRKMVYHRAQAIAYGAKLDTIKTDVKDTAKVEGSELSGNSEQLPNPDTLNQHCQELARELDSLKSLPKPDKPVTPKAVTKIQKTVCPQKALDSLYSVSFFIQDVEYKIPVRVRINASGGKLDYSVTTGEIKATFTKTEVKTGSVTTGSTREQIAMWIFLGILTGMGITFLLIWLIQRFVKRK